MARAGFTLIELLIVVTLVSLVVGIAVPGFIQARIRGRETGAVSALRAVNNAQASYSSVCGRDAYAVRFPVLGAPPPGSTSGFLSPDLTVSDAPVKSGYQFILQGGAEGGPGPSDCNGEPTHTSYYASAAPVSGQAAGMRAFATTQERFIWQDATGIAPAEPFTASQNVSMVEK